MKKLKTNISASAIQYAVILAVIIAFLLGGLVLFSGMNRQIQSQFDFQDRLRRNAISGIEYGKAFNEKLKIGIPHDIVLFEDGIDSIEITKKYWGAYMVLVSKAKHHNQVLTKLAMIGHTVKSDQPSLYLADLGSPLGLCGQTKIEGSCQLPKRGVKRAYIAGQHYVGNKLIYGPVSTSETRLPEMNRALLDQMYTPLPMAPLPWEQIDTITNSFEDPPLRFFSEGPISIDAGVVSGQVMIESADSIYVDGDAELEHVILKSPIVYFEEGFEGCVQVLAEHRVITEPHVKLVYPSVISVVERTPQVSNSTIQLGEHSAVIGSVVLTSRQPDFRKEVLLDIQPGAMVAGQAFCNGKTQLKGKVNGQLFTKKFYLKTASSTYENHLLNAEIIQDLPDNFFGYSTFK